MFAEHFIAFEDFLRILHTVATNSRYSDFEALGKGCGLSHNLLHLGQIFVTHYITLGQRLYQFVVGVRLDPMALDLMGSLLQFQSKNRVPAKTAMGHAYFSSLGPRIHMLPNSML